MSRRFREHHLRRADSLDGVWDFAFLGDVDPDSILPDAITYIDRMAVPGSFDALPTYAGQRGLAAYRTTALIYDETPHRLIFNSVHHWCRVFVASEHVGDHVGGFTRFAFDLAPRAPGEVEIVVLVDNRIDYQRCPLHLEYFDWYHFGGITRPVEWQRLGAVWVDSLRVETVDYAARRIAVTIDYGAQTVGGEVDFTLAVDGANILCERLPVTATRGQITRSIDLPDAGLWSPAAPKLHMLEVRLDDDDQRERFGIRQVEVVGREIRINGEATRLLGFNRHEAHPQFGHALTDQLLLSDVNQLRDLGCNFVRGSHYPQDVRFLDLCDEAGLAVWVEATGWQHTRKHLTDPHYMDAQMTNITEMIAMSRNHPSVIMWGIQNEGSSNDPECRPAYEMMMNRIRELDPTRPTTYASMHPFADVCFDLADLISIHCYPGWYIGEIDYIPEHLDRIAGAVNEAGMDQRPLIIAEIGAGAVPGWRDWNEARWSEQYQAQLIDTVIEHMFSASDRFAGLAIWQFCDIRSSEEVGRALGRPRGFNNKGVVDEYRRPKLAYEVVKKRFHALRSLVGNLEI